MKEKFDYGLNPTRKEKIKPARETILKQMLIFALALLPAFALGAVLIFMANRVDQDYKKYYRPEEFVYLSSDSTPTQAGYWHYLQNQKKLAEEDIRQKEGDLNPVDRLKKEWETQKYLMEIQQEQQKLEQQRIKTLLQQFKK